ncbi:dihydrolipoamide acetyltransferase family protein [Pseudonocardia acaciae]|uniref:dihydrolipoamide acetyltransferase family protein n=1 Tax=Pseudonocardia acaciae TaxID=551276 RepID=UPI00055FC1C6|nr:dihydrolipoamide acetyltransferase family protein [Pseudonocardia acaciae]
MRKVFTLPDAGEGLTEAEILTWRVAVGDTVEVNQVIVEVETAKAAVELPSPYAGTVVELLAEPGATVEVGAPIIAIADGAEEPAPPAQEPTENADPEPDARVPTLVGYGPKPGSSTRRPRKPPRVGAPGTPSRDVQHTAEPVEPAAPRTVPLAKPPVRKLARELGVDLAAVRGSGPGGVITREDLQDGHTPVPVPARRGGERREPIRGVRKATAQAVVSSAFTAPHVTVFLTVDVTPMLELRDRLRASREFAEVKLTPLAFAAKAVCLAARRTPEVNASWREDEGEIVYYDHVHLGIAAATPRGLIVPKIRDAHAMSLRELAAAIGQLTETARAGKTPPSDMVGGTVTISNVGVFGVDTGTPILNPGETAILAIGAIKQAPWVVDGELAVRTVCQLSLSFDHRLVDGEQGSRFLADVGALLADPGLALTY